MSNKSYSSKDNFYNMKDIQGGEQKVMKKILSVALSTAMAFSMFASVAFGAEASKDLTPDQKFDALKAAGIVNGLPDQQAHLEKTLTRAELAKIITKSVGLKEVNGVYSYKDKNYGPNHWAAPFVEAVTAAKIMQGTTVNGKQFFNPSNNVSVQELAIVLVNALDLEVPTTGIDNGAAVWAKGQVQAAINAGLLSKDLNWTATATRSQAVVAAYTVWEKAQVPTVASYKVNDATHVDFTLSNGEVVKVELKTALVANVETPVEFPDAAGHTIATKVTYVVTAATKVANASATNYKQIVVNFDGEVDATTAKNAGNYKLTGFTFKSATLSADKKTVTLLIASDSSTNKLATQTEYTLTVNGVKDATGAKTFNESVKFSAVDTTLPTVQSVTGLGTKAIKVVFSEPVTSLSASNLANYKVDGAAISGYVTYQYPNTAIITTTVAAGAHTLTVQGVEDYAGFKAVSGDTAFTVAEDAAAPEITSITSTDLYTVDVTFNEPVKSVASAYQTSSGKTASVSINDNVVTLTFDETNRLGLGESTIYLTGVTDYSDNKADRNGKVTPVLDVARPTVVGVTSSVNDTLGRTELTVEFSKAVNATDIAVADNYVLKKENGDVYTGKGFTSKGNPVNTPAFVVADSTTSTTKVLLTSIGKLPAGKYKLEVSGIRDRAAYGNTLLPQTIDFTVTETGALTATSSWYVENGDNYVVYVQYDKTFATSGAGNAVDINKYSYKVVNSYYAFPTSSASIAQYGANTIQITVPKDKAPNLKNASFIRVVNVADTIGNYVNANVEAPFAERDSSTVGLDSSDPIVATAKNKVAVTFNGVLSVVNKDDFNFTGLPTGTTWSVSNQTVADGKTTVEFTFSKDVFTTGATTAVRISTVDQRNITSADSLQRKITEFTSQRIVDAIAPSPAAANNAVVVAGSELIDIPFAEQIRVNYTPAAFVVRVNGTPVEVDSAKVKSGTTDTLEITLKNALAAGNKVEVYLQNNATGKYVTDTTNNAASDFYQIVTVAAAQVAPTATDVTVTGTAKVGEVLTGHYTFNDVNGDTEGTSTFKWYRSNDAAGTGQVVIANATASTYTLEDADLGKFITFEVTPVSTVAPAKGTAVASDPTDAVTAAE